MTRYACRDDDGRPFPNDEGSREVLYCPKCQFKYKERGCLFAPTPMAFSKPPAQKQGARMTNNLTGGKWKDEDILDRIIEYFLRNGKWPDNSTPFRVSVSPALPHSSTVTRHFGSIAEAVRQARELYEKENKEE